MNLEREAATLFIPLRRQSCDMGQTVGPIIYSGNPAL